MLTGTEFFIDRYQLPARLGAWKLIEGDTRVCVEGLDNKKRVKTGAKIEHSVGRAGAGGVSQRARRNKLRTRMNSVPTAPEIPAIATLGPSGVLPARTVTAPRAGRRTASDTRRLRLALALGAAYAPRAPESA